MKITIADAGYVGIFNAVVLVALVLTLLGIC